jgi:hypothetical protein
MRKHTTMSKKGGLLKGIENYLIIQNMFCNGVLDFNQFSPETLQTFRPKWMNYSKNALASSIKTLATNLQIEILTENE